MTDNDDPLHLRGKKPSSPPVKKEGPTLVGVLIILGKVVGVIVLGIFALSGLVLLTCTMGGKH